MDGDEKKDVFKIIGENESDDSEGERNTQERSEEEIKDAFKKVLSDAKSNSECGNIENVLQDMMKMMRVVTKIEMEAEATKKRIEAIPNMKHILSLTRYIELSKLIMEQSKNITMINLVTDDMDDEERSGIVRLQEKVAMNLLELSVTNAKLVNLLYTHMADVLDDMEKKREDKSDGETE